jgi:hypothetical protein
MDPKKLEDLKEWPLPSTGAQLQTFLGFVTFLRQHVRHFADLTSPLEEIKLSKELVWTDSLRTAFHATKQALLHAPFLQYPNYSKAFHIATDASNSGVGGVLYQPSSPDEHITPTNIVNTCSKKLSKSQRNYSAYKKELWAIVYCLRQFRPYVWGRDDLVIVTDHKPLTYILSSSELSNALQLWLDDILDFKFTIVHRPGILNIVPDALSRMYASLYPSVWGVSNFASPSPGSDRQLSSDNSDSTTTIALVTSFSRGEESAHMHTADFTQEPQSTSHEVSDDTLSVNPMPAVHGYDYDTPHHSSISMNDVCHINTMKLRSSTKALTPPSSSTPFVSTSSSSLTHLPQDSSLVVNEIDHNNAIDNNCINNYDSNNEERKEIVPEEKVEDNSISENKLVGTDLLIEMEKRGMMIPVDEKEKLDIINTEHALGHFGREAIYQAIHNKQIWWPNIRKDIQNVISNCDACNRFVVVKAGYHPAQYIHATGPWNHIQVDSSVHLPVSPDGYTVLLVVIDVFTGFVILRPLKTNDAASVARKLWKLFCMFGLPKIIQSDNGPEFVNDILRCLVKITGIDHRLISPYNPRADGKVERSIGSVMSIIKKLLHGSVQHWPLFVPFAQLSFNRKISSLTSSSPFSLMFGRALNEMKDYTTSTPSSINLDDWKGHQEKIVSLIYPSINEKVLVGKDKMITNLNKHRRVLLANSIPVGSTVMLLDPVRKNKFEPKYVGPYNVIRRSHNGNYVLKDMTGDILDRHVPADQLKLISKKEKNKNKSGQVYEIESIINHKGEPGSYEYLVKWKGYDVTESSWEPQNNFLDDSLIRSYWKKHSSTQ